MTAPFDQDGLWQKSVLFLNRSTAAPTFDERALWASLALELLGKAALSKINPCLIADPMDDGKSLLIAAGVSNDHSGFKSVAAKTVFSRCARAFPPFDAREAGRIAQNRNEDLHSASLPFAAVSEGVWWQRYWAQAVLLVHAQDRELVDLVGVGHVQTVESLLAENEKNLASRVQALIQRAQQRLALVAANAVSPKVAAELAAAKSLTYVTEHQDAATCPACDGVAYIYGDHTIASEIIYDEESPPVQVSTVLAEALACPHCGLVLDGPEFVAAAGLPESFEAEEDYDPGDGGYGND